MNRQLRFASAMSILSLLVVLGGERADAQVGNIVKTESGKVSGTTVEDGGEKVHIFKGIPYAAPPVGEGRWKAPQPVKPWSDVRDATKWASQCAQRAGSRMGEASQISEDCLYLNVVTAAKTSSEGGWNQDAVASNVTAGQRTFSQSHRRERLGTHLS